MLTIYLAMLDTEEEKKSFEKIYTNYKDAMIKIAYSILNDMEDAYDALDDAFVTLAKRINQLPKDEIYEKIYVFKVIKTHALKKYNINKKAAYIEPLNDMNSISTGNSPAEELVDREGIDRIVEYIKKLPNEYSDVLVFRYLLDKSYIEISSDLRINPNTVRTRVRRGTAMLQEIIKKEMKYEH